MLKELKGQSIWKWRTRSKIKIFASTEDYTVINFIYIAVKTFQCMTLKEKINNKIKINIYGCKDAMFSACQKKKTK